MIRKLIDRLLRKSEREAAPPAVPAIPLGQRVEIAAADHRIDPGLLDDNAVE